MVDPATATALTTAALTLAQPILKKGWYWMMGDPTFAASYRPYYLQGKLNAMPHLPSMANPFDSIDLPQIYKLYRSDKARHARDEEEKRWRQYERQLKQHELRERERIKQMSRMAEQAHLYQQLQNLGFSPDDITEYIENADPFPQFQL